MSDFLESVVFCNTGAIAVGERDRGEEPTFFQKNAVFTACLSFSFAQSK